MKTFTHPAPKLNEVLPAGRIATSPCLKYCYRCGGEMMVGVRYRHICNHCADSLNLGIISDLFISAVRGYPNLI